MSCYIACGCNLLQKGFCTGEADRVDAERVCQKLDIPFSTVDFSKAYWNGVFDRVLREYAAGSTPNPDVLCNRMVKFDCFLKHATQQLGADYVATGHYAQVAHLPAPA